MNETLTSLRELKKTIKRLKNNKTPGPDKVTVEMTPYDLSKGRITYRAR